jgi:hypothetical protein
VGSGVVALTVSRIFYSITYSFLALTPATSLYYGFIGGLITAMSGAGVIYWGDRSFRVTPDRAVYLAMSKLSQHPALLDLLGPNIILANPIRSYTLTNSHISLKQSFLPQWQSPSVSVCFTVRSAPQKHQISNPNIQTSSKEVLVSTIYTKKGMDEVIEYLAIDYDGTARMLLIGGEKQTFAVRRELAQHAQSVLHCQVIKKNDSSKI